MGDLTLGKIIRKMKYGRMRTSMVVKLSRHPFTCLENISYCKKAVPKIQYWSFMSDYCSRQPAYCLIGKKRLMAARGKEMPKGMKYIIG
ncbi:hypothetical protein TNIN_148141 [Trichonephila inaurata madagascariensis]|uniref:Uncharacterized protein n=1 Tax=Trichonephila inaurata madagascariensis TaxID=2747483 RepID=A0A8X6WSK8_9ARAC|nr:hypothetical protein TNIN_148141 [Trichonephila inaurata madagascariensis]